MILFYNSLLGILLSLSPAVEKSAKTQSYKFPYNLGSPEKELTMPKKLLEISGLSLCEIDENFLLAVQDEDGVIFYVDKHTGKVERELKFWKDGDYEGIEMVDSKIYVVKNTGTIYQVSQPGSPQQHVQKFNFFLNEENDVEGLGFDETRNRLLLACKAKAAEGAEYRFKRGIYAFDLNRHVMTEKPVLLISQDEIHDYLGTAPQIRRLDKVIEFFNANFAFSPSGLAVHPVTGNIYISSSVGKLILVISPEGEIIHIEKLNKKVHCQPEGICFEKDGTLYIANEGKSGDGLIYQFDYAPLKQ